MAYRANGRAEEAVALLEHVVNIRGTTLAESHPNRLTSEHNLAMAYLANGRIGKAVALLEHVVNMQKIRLTENHPDRLASERMLSRMLDWQAFESVDN